MNYSVANGVTSSGKILKGDVMTVHKGGVAIDTYVYGGNSKLDVNGGKAENTTLHTGGVLVASNGGSVYNTNVDYYGSFDLSGNAVASNTIVSEKGGLFNINDGGIAYDTILNGGNENLYAELNIAAGGTHKGSLQIGNGAVVEAEKGSIIDFTVADHSLTGGYLINDLSLIDGAPTYTITVKPKQDAGTYKLAQGAAAFTGTLSVYAGDNKTKYGNLAVNGTLKVGDNTYSLVKSGNNLSLTISGADDIPPAAPIVTVSAPVNGTVTVTASFSSDSVVKQYKIGNGAWINYTAPFSVSSNGAVYFLAKDAAGNKTESNITVSTIDTVKGLSASVNKYNLNLTWSKLTLAKGQKATYSIIVNGKTYSSKSNKFKLSKLAPGDYTYRVQGIITQKGKSDIKLGWTSEKVISVKDVTLPKKGKVKVTQLSQDSIQISISNFSDNSGSIAGYNIKVNGTTVATGYKGTTYTYEKKNLAGKLTVEVTATDPTGNESKPGKGKITIKDKTDPTKVTGLKADPAANEKTSYLSWTPATDNVGVVRYEVVINGKTYKTKTNSITVKKLKPGTQSFVVYALDKAKNRSVVSDAQSFTVKDITAPKGGKVKVSQASQDSIQVAISGFSDNSGSIAGYNIEVNDTPVATGYKGTTYTYKNDNLVGKITVEVSAVDPTGNVSKAKKGSVTIKAAAPETAASALDYEQALTGDNGCDLTAWNDNTASADTGIDLCGLNSDASLDFGPVGDLTAAWDNMGAAVDMLTQDEKAGKLFETALA